MCRLWYVLIRPAGTTFEEEHLISATTLCISLECIYIAKYDTWTFQSQDQFITNRETHKYRTVFNNNLHLPTVNLSKFNKGVYITGAKVFNRLLQYIKPLVNDLKCFKSTLKGFLCHHSFYSMDEYYEFKEDR